MSLYVGLDIGGTKFLAASAEGNLQIVRRVRKSAPEALDEGLELLHSMIQEVAGGGAIDGIGAAIGGPLDWETGVVSPLHQPAWRSVPLKQIMEARWTCPFRVDVDTNIAALGEYHACEEKPARFLYVTVSTGMGGGQLENGRIVRATGGAHPEVGHQSVDFRCRNRRGVVCECGASDCLEALVCGNGIRRIYGRPAEELDQGEWNEVGYNLGQGLRNIAALLVPDVIVLGGGVALGAGEKLLRPARTVLEESLRIVPVPQVRLSELGYDTALIGALTAAKNGLR